MFIRNSGLFLFFMLFVFLCGSLIFLGGFFPDAYVKGGDVQSVDGTQRPTAVKGLAITPPKQKYQQIILMIVDALGFSFVNPSDSMPFVHQHRCERLKLRVAIPTVTLPRIKSLMTGTISNFIDIIRNLGETEELTDSLLHVLRKHNRIINFAGDRTWTGLFPSEFTREEANMDSFFVHDFYEGDRQVVETLRKEIDEPDWSLLILHFLGFDHIGHVEGSSSLKIPQKLKEMDNVISEISKNKYFENRLLLVTGDHGMRIGGGHGGSTEEELTVPLLFFNKNCIKSKIINKTQEYNQIDLTPTLAILMSVEIPKPSVGQLIPELLQNFSQEERLYAYFYNAEHLIHKANVKYGETNVKKRGYSDWFNEAQIAHREFIKSRQQSLPGAFHYEQALQNYQRVSIEISKSLSESLVKFDYGLISVGLFLTTTATVYTVIFLLLTENRQRPFSKSDLILTVSLWIVSLVIALILNITTQELELINANSLQRNCLYIASITVGVFMSLNISKEIQKLVLPLPGAARLKFVWSFPKLLLAAFLLTVIQLGSSSYIEYEHRTWHYLGVTCLLWLTAKNVQRKFYDETVEFKNGGNYLISFVHKNKSQILLSFIILSLLRFLSVFNVASHRVWTAWLTLFKDFGLSLLFIGSLVLLLLILRKFVTPYQRKASIGVVISIVLFRGFQGKVAFFPAGEFGSFAALCLFWIFFLITGFVNLASLLSRDGRAFERLLRNCFICSLLIAALLHQTHNVVLLPCLVYVLDYAYNFCDNLKLFTREPYKERYKLACKTFLTIFIANMFYFYQGNSNSLATIDLNPGYIGQSTYNPAIVAIFVTLNTFSAPINAFLYFFLHILSNENRFSLNDLSTSGTSKKYFGALSENENLSLVMSLYTAATLLPVAFYLGLMIIFRYHLFIYSVFAPKVFYDCYRVLVFFLMYCGFQIFMFLSK